MYLCVGGYINISYTMLLPLFLSSLDLCSDIIFIWRVNESKWLVGRTFLLASLFVLTTSIFFNFCAFFGIFIYSHRQGKVRYPEIRASSRFTLTSLEAYTYDIASINRRLCNVFVNINHENIDMNLSGTLHCRYSKKCGKN